MKTANPSTPSLQRKIDFAHASAATLPSLFNREWLVTNGLGGYASGTISGAVTWRYHGLLIAALPAPLGRVFMFNHLCEYLRFPDGRRVQIGGEETNHASGPHAGGNFTTEFRLEDQM